MATADGRTRPLTNKQIETATARIMRTLGEAQEAVPEVPTKQVDIPALIRDPSWFLIAWGSEYLEWIPAGSVTGREQAVPRQTQAVGSPARGSRPASQLASSRAGVSPGRVTTIASSGPSTRRARRARESVAAPGSPTTTATESLTGDWRR